MLSPTSLLCKEDLGSLACEDEEILVYENDDDDYIQTLLDKEIRDGVSQMQDLLRNSWIQRGRLEGIDYILRVCTKTHLVCV